MHKFRTEGFKGVLLSALLVTSLLAVFSLYVSNSKITTAPKAPEVLIASGTFTLTTYPIADAYVEEGHPTSNYGTQTKIIARSCDTGTGSNGQMRGFLKFDISSIPAGATITGAKLRLHGYYITEYIKNVSDVQIRQVTDDSWVESSINWNNQPAYGSVLSNIILLDNDSWAGSHPIDNWYENDVTSFVKTQFDNGDTTISLMIRCMQEYYDNLYYRGSYYHSKEAALENRPTLIVTYEQPLEHGVSVSVAPDTKDNLQGSVSSFVVTVTNTGSHQENYIMTIGDNDNWGLILSGDNLTVDNKLENVSPGYNRILTLTVAILDNATIGALDNIWIKVTAVDNENVTDNSYCIVRCTDEIKPTADAYVSDLWPDNKNNRLEIGVQSFTRENGNLRTFIKFPLSDIPSGKNVVSAKVMLYCWAASDDDVDAQICGVDNDNWLENEITWSSQPSIGDPLDTQTLTSWPTTIENSWISWEARDLLTQQRFYGDNNASFCIKAEVENTSGNYLFESRSYTVEQLRPKLVITFGDVQRAVSVSSISPVHRIGDNGVTENYTVNIINKGNVIDNYTLSSTDTAGWTSTFDTTSFLNVIPGQSITTTLHVAIPGGAAPGAVDNIKVTATGTSVADNEYVTTSVRKLSSWVVAGYSPDIENYGTAVAGAGNYIYVVTSNSFGTRVNFMRYDPTAGGSWTYLATPPVSSPFKNGTVLAWDSGNYIYTLGGGSYEDNAANSNARHYFWRYHIDNNWWENLAPTGNTDNENNNLGAQGYGDAIAVDTTDNYVYAILGQRYIGSTFWRYSIANNTWENRAFLWSSTDDGCSLVWTGGDFIYAFRGQSSTITKSFSRYSISGNSWTSMADTPEGVDDGGSLLWISGDNIYALLGGNSSTENARDNCFFAYSIKNNNWMKLENLPSGIADPNGPRMGSTGGNVYIWRGPCNPTKEYNPVLWVYALPPPPGALVVLSVGWNNVCFTAVDNTKDTPANVFPGLTYLTDYVIYWWKIGVGYKLQGASTPFNDNSGYWVYISTTKTVTTSGMRPPTRNIICSVGWNMVGFPVDNANTTPANVFTGLTYLTDYVIYWWKIGVGYKLQGVNTALNDNAGCWVWINQDKTVMVP